VLVVGGRDRLRFLHALVAQDVGALVPGQGAYGALTDERGRPIADYNLVVLPEAVLLELPEGRAEEARTALDRRVIADDVVTAWAAGTTVAYEAGDPAALGASLVAARAGRFVPPVAALADLAPGAWYAPGEPVPHEGEEALALVPANRQAMLRATRLGGFGVLHWPGGPSPSGLLSAAEIEALEIMAGRMAAPELAEAKVWNELGVLAAVSLTKGCWMGQEIVRRVHSRGEVKRRLGGVTLDAPDAAGLCGARLEMADGAPVGVVTRAARSVDAGLTVGLAFLDRAAWDAGAPLVAVRGNGTRLAARRTPLPLVRRVPTGAGIPLFEPLETP
jgi:folate-binding protein YgfZ